MILLIRVSLTICAGWLFQIALAADPEVVLEDQAAALLAVQLYSEAAEDLRQNFVRQGRSSDDADALAFHAIDNAAHCSVREFGAHNMPQIRTFLNLLIRNEELSSVAGALAKMYDKAELDEMQTEIARVVNTCLESSQAPVTP